MELLQKLRKCKTYRIVDNHGTKTSADDEDDRLVCRETTEIKGGDLVTGEQFLTDRRTGQYSFVSRKMFQRFRKLQQKPLRQMEGTTCWRVRASYQIHG